MQNQAIPEHVKVTIYLLTNHHPDARLKRYVGQTRTHVLNHKVYRPFGAKKRWQQHITESQKNDSKRQCWKLNNAIRLYGADSFELEELGDCDLDVADMFERMFISLYDVVRNGYNIQHGGRAGEKNAEESKVKITDTAKANNDKRRAEQYQGKAATELRYIK